MVFRTCYSQPICSAAFTPSQDCLGFLIQQPTSRTTGSLVFAHCDLRSYILSCQPSSLLATPTTCQPASQPVGAIMTVPRGYMLSLLTLLMPVESVGTVMTTHHPAQPVLWPFSWFTCFCPFSLTWLPHLLSFLPTMCLLR